MIHHFLLYLVLESLSRERERVRVRGVEFENSLWSKSTTKSKTKYLFKFALDQLPSSQPFSRLREKGFLRHLY
jgi:hypothetical protein